MNIQWDRVARAIQYYQGCGYHYIETPWVVPGSVSAITFPEQMTAESVHVGSAEQGFLDLMLKGKLLTEQMYVSAGPCFRPQDAGKPDHEPWFFKVELFAIYHIGEPLWMEDVMTDAFDYFQFETGLTPDVVVTEDGKDLYLNGLEIGSYGVRTYQGHSWVYGTGLAEPRLSLALSRSKGLDLVR